jgi:hypothetical protein
MVPKTAPQIASDTALPRDRIKSTWDRLVILAGLAYGLGYFSRALHAWDSNFGALPGVQFDYLVAGFLLSLPVVVLSGAAWLIYKGSALLRAWGKQNRTEAIFLQARVLSPMAGVSAVVFVVSIWFITEESQQKWIQGICLAVILLGMALGAIVTPENEHKHEPSPAPLTRRSPWFRLMHQCWGALVFLAAYGVKAYFVVTFFFLFFTAAFAGAAILRYLPQELGGVKPKCAILDIIVEQVSPELALILLPPSGTAPVTKVVRSKQINVYSTTGPWLIRTPDASTTGQARSLRLSSSAVGSVEWLRTGACEIPPSVAPAETG